MPRSRLTSTPPPQPPASHSLHQDQHAHEGQAGQVDQGGGQVAGQPGHDAMQGSHIPRGSQAGLVCRRGLSND